MNSTNFTKQLKVNLRFVLISSQLNSKPIFKTIFLSILLILSIKSSYGQAASSTWALTSNATASIAGNVTAGNQTSGSGISSVSYGASGVQSLGWQGASQMANSYYQFTISPVSGNYLTVASISTTNMMTSGGGTALIQYSLNSSFTSPTSVGSPFSVSGSTVTNTFSSLSINVNSGQTLYVRIFAWGAGNNTNKFFFCRNFIISGTTSAVVCPSSPTAGSNSPICAGTNLNLTSSASGVPLSFSWTGPNGFSSSVQNPTLSSATTAASGIYTVTISNTCGSTSSTTSVMVNPIPTTTATPASQNICSGNSITDIILGTSNGVSGTTYSWTRDNTGSVTGIASSGTTDISGTLTNTTNSPVTVTFTINSSANGCAGTTTTSTVTVNPIPVGSASAQTICSGTATGVALSSTVSGTTFTWTAALTTIPAGGTITGFSNSSGSTIAQTLTNTGTTDGVVEYTVVPTANGCTGAAFTVDVTINPKPVGSASPQTICSATATSVALNSTLSGTTFTWTAVINTIPAGGTITGFSNSSGSTIAQTLTNTGTTNGVVRYTVTPSAGGCAGTAFTVDVTVKPKPVATSTPSSASICSGTAPGLALTSNVAGSSFSWTVLQGSGISGGSDCPSSCGTSIAQTLTNSGTTAGTATYTITPSANGCAGNSITAIVTVKPIPSGSASPQTICGGATTSVTLNSTVSGSSFTWTAAQLSGATVTGFTNCSSSCGTTIAQTLTNNGSTAGVVRYTVIPTANNCSGSSFTVDVTVNPKPVTTATPSSQSICSGNAVTTIVLGTSNGLTGTTYSWTRNNTASVTGIAASGTTDISGSLTNTTASPVTVTFTINSTSASGCTGTTVNATIIINPLPVTPSITATPSTICNGSSSNLVANPSTPIATTILSENFEGVSTFTLVNVGATTAGTEWILRTSPFSQNSLTYNSGSKFMLANSSVGGNGSTTNTALVSPAVSSLNYSTLSLTFTTYGRFTGGSSGNIEVSINGGGTWTTVSSLSNTGSASSFVLTNISLNAFANVASLIIRFRYEAANDDSWAIDNVSLTGTPIIYNYSWSGNPSVTAGLPAGAGTPSTSNSNINVSPSATTVYTATLTDPGGCTSSSTTTVSVNQPPSISVQPVSTSACPGASASFSVTALGTGLSYQWRKGTTNLSNGGNISGATSASLTINPVSASDVASNYNVVVTGTCAPSITSNNISLSLNSVPIIGACPTDIIQCDNHLVSFSTPSATATPAASVSCSPVSGSFFATGTTVVTCTATNSCGSSSCSFNVTINETPVIGTCPSDIVQCNNPIVNFSTPSSTGTPAATVTCSPASGSTFAIGTTQVNCTATNSCNTSTCSFNVTVNEAPVISGCPSDISQCDNPIATWSTPTSSGSPAPSVTCSPASGSSFSVGTTSVTCTATNSCGSSSCSFSVTINTSASITCPSDIVTCNPVVTFAPTSSGSPAPTVSCTPASGSTFAVGTTQVNCSATNSCNAATCSFNVTVNEAPVISACPSDIVQCDNNIATWTDPTSSGSPAPSVVCSPASGSSFSIGTTSVTCTATNSCGSSSCSFSVTINTSAGISCPSDIVTCNPVVTFAPTSSGSPAPTVLCTPASGSTFAVGTTQVNCSATNSCNAATCSFNVTVNEAPLISACPSDIVQCDNNIATWTDPTATGTPAPTILCTPASGSTFANGTTVVTCTATNSCSSSSCSFNVTISSSPTVDAGPAQTICYTGTATMNGSIGGGATTATWSSLGDGSFNDANQLNAVYTPGPNDVTNGSVTLVLTTDFQGACIAATDQTNLTIIYSPTPPPGTVTGPSPACPGNTLTFSIAPVAGATSYMWSSIDATTTIVNGQGTTSADILFGNLPTGQSTYPLSVIAVNQCGNSVPRTFAPRGKISQPNFSGATPSVICQNTNGVTFSVTPVSGASSYSWTITGSGATIVGPANGSSVTVDFGTYSSVTINVTASNACMTTPARTKTITSTPAVPGTVTGQSYPCPGGTYVYSVSPVVGASTYNWSGPAGSVVTGNSNSVSITFGPSVPGGSNVSVSATGSCSNTSTLRLKGVASGIPNIPSTISGPASGQCGQLGVSYSAVPNSNQPLATSYTWSVNNGSTIAGPNNFSAVSVDFPATFTNVNVSVVSNNACGSSNPRNLSVNAFPSIPVSISGNATPCAGNVETYCATGSAGATGFIWTVPQSWTVLNTSPPCITVITGATGGAITCRGANACGQSSAKTKPVSVPCRQSQVIQANELSDIQLYPNPAQDKATLKFSSSHVSDYTISLIESTGKVVYNSKGVVMEGENMIELNLANYSKGIYMLQMIRDGEQQMLRLVVE